ncbi:threonine/homoserine/homoserine lactone efflux protein [Rhizomicrobium palustre]|uniref:Threonine/homoserine/homoserine lactone efflux protein n=1 Tax=Rhizomicrobium palustre TaxID=189966 RepID=A0A846N261_9PROT|nr:LysE family transporter [Rhizomicrobium palustre]NIK90074.1 threonine/homoserine/homoserine lactone efflux protein [Rhizomicrobium palustre]
MDYVGIILTGWIVGLIAAIPIGPVNLICIRRTLQFGSLYGFLSGLGAALGDGIFACIAAFSLTAISQVIAGYSTPLQIVGGIMLLVIGVRMFLAPPPPRIGDTYGPPANGKNGRPVVNGGAKLPAKGMATTFALTTTNPMTFAGFVAWSSSLGGLSHSPSFFDASFWVIGVVVGSTTWWATLTTVVGKLHAKIDDRAVQMINRVSGVLVFLFGLVVLVHVAFPMTWRSAIAG